MKLSLKNTFAALVLPACAALALLGSTVTTEAAIFIKMPGIPGDAQANSQDAKHKEWIEVLSVGTPIYRAMVTDPATGIQRRRGDVILDDITCSKILDKASPKLAEAICSGTFFPEVEIHFTKTITATQADGTVLETEEPYMTLKLKDVIVTSYGFHGTADGDPPTEDLTLGYTEIEWTYISQSADGKHSIAYIGPCDADPSGDE